MQELLRIFIYEILYNDVSSTRYVLNQVSFTSALYMHYFISNKQLLDWLDSVLRRIGNISDI